MPMYANDIREISRYLADKESTGILEIEPPPDAVVFTPETITTIKTHWGVYTEILYPELVRLTKGGYFDTTVEVPSKRYGEGVWVRVSARRLAPDQRVRLVLTVTPSPRRVPHVRHQRG